MLPQNDYIVLFANCIPVKGVNRSAICDLQRANIKLIPNDLYNVILASKKLTIAGVKKKFDNKYDDIIEEYFTFLITNELAFTTQTPDLFPDLDMQWHESSVINNAIIDVSKNSSFSILEVLQQLDLLNCKNVQIRFFKQTSEKEIQQILFFLDKKESFITSVEFILPYLNKALLQKIITSSRRVSSVTLYNSKKNEISSYQDVVITNTSENITSEKHCGIISQNLFTPNIKVFTESKQFNSCLNRKISVDVEGNIKNCPSMPQAFGNIESTKLVDVLAREGFKKQWDITKDEIDTCKDCEFRYVCVDCRAYLETPKNLKSKPLKCGYNPYNSVWENWATNPLKKEAIDFYNLTEID